MRIGLDFDNTIAGYDRLFRGIAIDAGLLPADFAGSKKQVRDQIRALPDGEAQWTRLQAIAYGRRMAEAELIEGVAFFLVACRRRSMPVFIVSHKSRFAAADPEGVDLRAAALAWMEGKGFFVGQGFGIPRGNVFFEDSRAAKCRRIAALGLSHFIDDLEEVFRDPAFPDGVERLLFHAGNEPTAPGPYQRHADWQSISRVLFGDA